MEPSSKQNGKKRGKKQMTKAGVAKWLKAPGLKMKQKVLFCLKGEAQNHFVGNLVRLVRHRRFESCPPQTTTKKRGEGMND